MALIVEVQHMDQLGITIYNYVGVADQSTVVHQSFYYLQSKHDAETETMDKIDAETIQKQLEMWEAATAAQRRYVDAQGKTSAARLEELRKEAEFLTSAANAYHWILCRAPSSFVIDAPQAD